jgi:hypothetical protein
VDGAVQGILPLALVPGLVGPRRLVSLPFSYAAGPAAVSPTVDQELVEAARAHAAEQGVTRLEIKRRGTAPPPEHGAQRVMHYVTYRLEPGPDPWSRLDASSTRRGIKRAQQLNVQAVPGAGAADWEAMGRLQERTSRAHGVPAPPRRFFTDTCQRLQRMGLADLRLARLADGRIAAGVVIWRGAGEWIYAFGASDPRTLEYRPNHLLLWTILQEAAREGVVFDLGRAAPEQEGLTEFKRRWGGQPIPLAYDYWPKASGLNVRPRDRGLLAAAARLWSLLPAPVARLGSGLYRYLG